MFWNSFLHIHRHNHIALPVRFYSERILCGLWPVNLRLNTRGILFLLLQSFISGHLFLRFRKLKLDYIIFGRGRCGTFDDCCCSFFHIMIDIVNMSFWMSTVSMLDWLFVIQLWYKHSLVIGLFDLTFVSMLMLLMFQLYVSYIWSRLFFHM